LTAHALRLAGLGDRRLTTGLDEPPALLLPSIFKVGNAYNTWPSEVRRAWST